MKKVMVSFIILSGLFSGSVFSASFDWAAEAVRYCIENHILHGMDDGDLALGDNITNEQMAKLLVSTFLPDQTGTAEDLQDSGIAAERWSAPFIAVFKNYTKKPIKADNVASAATREEFVSSLVLASGLTEKNIRNRDILSANFEDYRDVGSEYTTLLCIAVERGYMKGAEGKLNPKEKITRAEACSLIYRVIRATEKGEILDLGVKASVTDLVAPSKVSVEQAKQWAKNKGAADIFIEAADLYWKYGELSGICPEILYAQAAKETKFGQYGGSVLPEQNNWAGIKVAGATGDATYDHESFATPEDGVRGHFNHMSAYVGLEPIGEPHGRYAAVSKMSWAGTVTSLEELGGKWCPDLYYGYSILHNLLEPMINTEI